MHSRWPSAVVSLVCLLGAAPHSRAGDDLGAKIRKVITRPEYRHSRWGILVIDAVTKQPVFEHNADQLFAPASVTKLFTCAAALAALGPDSRFETPVFRRGEVKDGHLQGDLILLARGDPTLGGRTDARGRLAFKNHDHTYANFLGGKAELTDTDPLAGLKDLARQVKARGIDRVDGEVLIDARLFSRERGSGSGPTVLLPVLINDNLLDVVITPAKKVGEPAAVKVRPQTAYMQVDVRVQTVDAEEKPVIETARVGPERYVVRGKVPAGSRPLLGICLVDDPIGFARALFIEELRRAGVEVRASALAAPAATLPDKESYDKMTEVARHTSPPFSEVIKVTLKVSHNLYASTLPLLLAAKAGKRTLAEGMRLEGKILAELGVDVHNISLQSGAGGGNGDRVTPRATVQLLVAMARRPEYDAFKAGLPVLGVDGTLNDIGADGPARGKVWAKTGTYGDADLLNGRVLLRSKSLAGVMTTAKGRRLVFAMFVNDVPLPRGAEPGREAQVLGKLCEVLYEHGP